MPKKWDIKSIAKSLGFMKDHHGHKHNCDDTLKRVMLSLDGELSEEEEKKFLDDLNCCSRCLEKFKIEKSFKDYLTQKISRKSISSKAVDSIRSQVFGDSKRL